ncbi:unnamed protein product [Heterobilharzia americana]|nr:unnamed protein product [Heterobilharzia americana]
MENDEFLVNTADIQYNHEDGTIVTKRKLPKSSSSQPVTWNLSEEGRHLIGHMILRKKTDPHFGEPGSVLGTPADIVGQLRPGDEILEWNGQSLRGLSADEVSQIIYQSKDEIQVELIAQRELSQTENTPTDDVVLMVPSPSECFSRNGIDSEERIPRSSLQMKLFYDEIKRQLIVNVLAAQNLSTIHRPFRGPCAFYCRLCLLPEQEEYNCRCTKLVRGSSNPIWNQAFRFTNLSDNDLNSHHLEVTIWSCVENTDEQHKIGEIVIDLSVADLLDVAYWYPIRSINRFFSTSELSNMNPEVSTGAFDFQQYENQVPEKLIKPRYYEPEQWSPRTIYRDSGNPDDELRKQRSSRDTRNEVRRDDYSDIDEQKFSANSRQNRKYAERDYQQRENEEHHRGSRRHPKNPNYDYGGVDENAIQSDASEFSDLSELSRMSLHTTHSDRHRVESMQMHRAVNQQFQTPTQSRGDRYPQNSQTSSRLDQQFSPSTEQPARIRRDSNRLETETSGLVEERVIPKDSGNSEGGFGQGTSSTGSAGGRDPRIMVENKQSTSEIAQSIERDQVDGRKRRPNIGQKFSHVLGRSSKSSSTSTLDKKSRTSFQRSEEVLPLGDMVPF